MKREIAVFIPNKTWYIQEFNVLYHNFKHLGLDKMDTYIHVFCSEQVIKYIVSSYTGILRNVIFTISPESYAPELKYEYLNSLAIFHDNVYNHPNLYPHKAILKTDTDVFLTPNFIDWNPEDKFYVGRGGYSNIEVAKKTIEVSKELGLTHRGIHNLGATWYGAAEDIIKVGRLATDVTKYILAKHFQERKFNWPNWTYGVASMYASEIAINHLVADKLVIDASKLDYFSDSENSINQTHHIHCWHTDKRYSKFWFRDGKYKNIDKSTLDTNKISDYCLAIALESNEQRV